MTDASAKSPFLSPALAVGLLVVSAISLVALFALSAFAPELRSQNSAGTDALSNSAVGYAGLRFLLQETGTGVRLERVPAAGPMIVLTPTAATTAAELRAILRPPGSKLIVLPKWDSSADPQHLGWVVLNGTIQSGALTRLLDGTVRGAAIGRASGTSGIRLESRASRFDAIMPAGELRIRTLQTIFRINLEPLVTARAGEPVLARVAGTETYILSEPDLVNNFGIRDLAAAEFAVGLVRTLRAGRLPVSFDLTLNGFRNDPSFLRGAFSPPFLGATLCLVLAALFIAVHALNRFGPAKTTEASQAMGKRGLADNTAAVIRMLHREARMAPRYAEAMLNSVAARTGVSRDRAGEAAWLKAIEARGSTPYRFEELSAEARTIGRVAELLALARKLYDWRQGVTHGHR